jgi:hypothetical protein
MADQEGWESGFSLESLRLRLDQATGPSDSLNLVLMLLSHSAGDGAVTELC